MECCKRAPKMPSKTGVSRAEIVTHAFECSVGSMGGCEAIQGPRRGCDKKGAAAVTPRVGTDAFTLLIGVHSRNHRRMPYRATLPVRSKRGAVQGSPIGSICIKATAVIRFLRSIQK